jgi:histidyl-tRNA synthetase
VLQELRRAGVAADMDYAGRSTKGQLSHALRSGAETIVILREHDAVIRRSQREDKVVDPGELVATLTAQ